MEYRVCISSQFVMVMGKTGTMFQILLEKNFIVSDFFSNFLVQIMEQLKIANNHSTGS
jgi:hypothetical protein